VQSCTFPVNTDSSTRTSGTSLFVLLEPDRLCTQRFPPVLQLHFQLRQQLPHLCRLAPLEISLEVHEDFPEVPGDLQKPHNVSLGYFLASRGTKKRDGEAMQPRQEVDA
jgi:hypothetical protein